MKTRRDGKLWLVCAGFAAIAFSQTKLEASLYTVSGNYDVVYPSAAAGTGTFSFEISGTYDNTVQSPTVVAPGDSTAPFDFVGGESFITGPVAGTSNYILNDPTLNFQVTFPDAFDGSIQTGGSGTSFANDVDYANLSDVTVNAVSGSVPEPTSIAMLGLGSVALLGRRRRPSLA